MKILVALQHSRASFSSSKMFASALQDKLTKDFQIIFPEKGTEEELVELASDVDVIVCYNLPKEVAQAAKKVKFIQRTGVGVDNVAFDNLRSDVVVANTSGANPVPLAEGAVSLVLALAKQVVSRHNLFPQGYDTVRRGVELRGKNAGIIGLGHIGMEVARLLGAFEMKILAIKRHPEDPLETPLAIDFVGGPDDLDYLLKESDFVVITLPLTPETRGMIGERELHMMKTTAYLVNIARGAIIQEEPLYKALKERWIAGAAIDVWWQEHWWDSKWNPNGVTPKFEFWKLPNVIATPHNIGSVDARTDDEFRVIVENIRRFAEGKPPINQVDTKLQY